MLDRIPSEISAIGEFTRLACLINRYEDSQAELAQFRLLFPPEGIPAIQGLFSQS